MAECLTITIKSKMPNNHQAAVLVTGWLLFVSAAEASEQKLCDQRSVPIFQCEVGNGKNVALCADYDRLGKLVSLQYRFGKTNNLELIYPTNTASSIERFRFNRYFRSGVEYVKVGFLNGSFKYGLFKNYDENEAENSNYGVEVIDERNRVSEIQILCRKVFEDTLQSLSNLSCDEDDALGCDR